MAKAWSKIHLHKTTFPLNARRLVVPHPQPKLQQLQTSLCIDNFKYILYKFKMGQICLIA